MYLKDLIHIIHFIFSHIIISYFKRKLRISKEMIKIINETRKRCAIFLQGNNYLNYQYLWTYIYYKNIFITSNTYKSIKYCDIFFNINPSPSYLILNNVIYKINNSKEFIWFTENLSLNNIKHFKILGIPTLLPDRKKKNVKNFYWSI